MNKKKPGSLPNPLVPADVDLTGFSSFLLNVERLLASELVALATPEEGWAAIMLWCRSFQQRPPGSLPDDDRVLAAYSKAGVRWPEVKDMALRGFVLCSDGRLYHRTMAEVVNEAWTSRVEHRETIEQKNERQKRWRDRQRELSTMLRGHGITPPKGASLSTLESLLKDAQQTSTVDAERRDVDAYGGVSVDAGEMPKKGSRREGEGEGEEKNPYRVLPPSEVVTPPGSPRATVAAKASRLPSDWQPDVDERAFAIGEGFGDSDVDRIGDGFRDYWLAKAGADARKADWHATWRNWVRNEGKRQNGRGPHAGSAKQSSRPTLGVPSALAGIDAYFNAKDH